MDEQQAIAFEERIQRLLAGVLNERETRAVLLRVAQDDQARAELVRVLVLQDEARAALGVALPQDATGDAIRQMMRNLPLPGAAAQPLRAERASGGHRWTQPLLWMARAAAVLLLAGCVWMTVLARRDSQAVREEMTRLRTEVRVPGLEPGELARLEQVWAEVARNGEQRRPWVFLSSGTGEFGYVQTESTPGRGNGPILLRCVVADGAGRPIKQMNLILPGRQTCAFDVRHAGELRGRPVQVGVAISGTSTVLDLKVGGGSTGAVGLRAVAPVGREASEVGQFRLGSEKARVFLQAIPMQAKPA